MLGSIHDKLLGTVIFITVLFPLVCCEKNDSNVMVVPYFTVVNDYTYTGNVIHCGTMLQYVRRAMTITTDDVGCLCRPYTYRAMRYFEYFFHILGVTSNSTMVSKDIQKYIKKIHHAFHVIDTGVAPITRYTLSDIVIGRKLESELDYLKSTWDYHLQSTMGNNIYIEKVNIWAFGGIYFAELNMAFHPNYIKREYLSEQVFRKILLKELTENLNDTYEHKFQIHDWKPPKKENATMLQTLVNCNVDEQILRRFSVQFAMDDSDDPEMCVLQKVYNLVNLSPYGSLLRGISVRSHNGIHHAEIYFSPEARFPVSAASQKDIVNRIVDSYWSQNGNQSARMNLRYVTDGVLELVLEVACTTAIILKNGTDLCVVVVPPTGASSNLGHSWNGVIYITIAVFGILINGNLEY